MRPVAPILALIALAACARSEDASTLPSDSNGLAPATSPARSAEGDEDELAIGEWRDSLQDDAQALEFGPQGAAPLFSMRCDSRRGVVLQRHGIPLTGDLPMMMVTIGNDTRRLAVTGGTGTIPMLRATLTARDPLLATLAQEGSPITVRVGDTPPLVLPPSPTIGEFVALCASGGGQSGDEEGANEAAPQENAASPANEVAPAR
jgi:hypothetical protein